MARNALLAIAAARIGVGFGALFATRPALGSLGFSDPGPQARALARIAGSRDVALGALTILARDDAPALRAAAGAGIAVDALDSVTLGLAGARHSELRLAGALGVLAGGAAVAVGAWALGSLAAE